MKHIQTLTLLAAVFFIASCKGGSDGRTGSRKARIEFADTLHDFGDIAFSSEGSYEFVFTNTGRKELLLRNVKSTCGCTVPEWPHEPVAPGDTAGILVKYDTRRVGAFSKSVYVYSNAVNSPNRLLIRGRVETAQPADQTQ